MDQELLEEIRLLSNLETTKAKMIQIVLVGQPELDEFLKQPRFRQIKQRINLRYHLRPLSDNETEEYIEKRLKITEAKSPLFTRRAVKEVYYYSRGIPRLINILCDNSLLNAFASDQTVVDMECVEEAAKDLNIDRPPIRKMLRFLSSIISR
jgi:general secretion pathway protein A